MSVTVRHALICCFTDLFLLAGSHCHHSHRGWMHRERKGGTLNLHMVFSMVCVSHEFIKMVPFQQHVNFFSLIYGKKQSFMDFYGQC